MIVQKKYKNEGVETMAKKYYLFSLYFPWCFRQYLTAEEKVNLINESTTIHSASPHSNASFEDGVLRN